MKIKNRLILDYLMLLALLVLMVSPVTGRFVHEVLGCVFTLLAVYHCFFDRKWVRNIFKPLRRKNSPQQKKALMVINGLLLVSLLMTVISGIMVSVILFSFLNITFKESFFAIHALAARATLFLSLVHLIMHKRIIRAILHANAVCDRKEPEDRSQESE